MCCNIPMTHFFYSSFFPLLFKQTIVFKGSLGARINELKQRVIAENPHRFAVAVPRESPNTYTYCTYTPYLTYTSKFLFCVPTDTTRPKKPHEKEGVEYHFVTKQQFDADALNNKYVHTNTVLLLCKRI